MTKLVAEIGINYAYGDRREKFVDNAVMLMTQAKLAGFDYVKLQKRNPSVSTPEKMKDKARWTPWRKDLNATYLQYKEDVELTSNEWDILFLKAKELGIKLFASVWDMDSLLFMKEKVQEHSAESIVKIPSAKITDLQLCKKARELFNTLIIST